MDCSPTVCTPTAEVANLTVAPAGPGQFLFSWDPSLDPCLDHYLLLGANDPSSRGGFVTVANTGTTTSYTAAPPFSYYLVVVESADGQQGALGHFGE